MRRLSLHLLLLFFSLLFIAGASSVISAHQESSNSLLVSTFRSDIIAQGNQAGALTWTASYEAFGTRPVEYGSNADRQRANTKEEDPTGLLWEHFRYRDLETGVWLSRDPAGFVDGPNLYAYVNQNPWSKFDPQGLWIEDVAIGVPSLVIGVKSAFDNFRAGNIGYGALDTAGAIVDIAAIIAPGIPGGAGLAIKAARYGEKAMDVVNTATTAVEVGQSLSEGDYGGAALAAATGGIGTPGRGKKSHKEHNGMVASSHGGGANISLTESAKEVSTKTPHKNSLDYEGDTHVYAIRNPDATVIKVGESAQGVRKRDGASKRAEQQVRKLNRDTGPGHTAEIRKTFKTKRDARSYETKLIERYRKRNGNNKLSRNKTNR